MCRDHRKPFEVAQYSLQHDVRVRHESDRLGSYGVGRIKIQRLPLWPRRVDVIPALAAIIC